MKESKSRCKGQTLLVFLIWLAPPRNYLSQTESKNDIIHHNHDSRSTLMDDPNRQNGMIAPNPFEICSQNLLFFFMKLNTQLAFHPI
jgi:hypothetical protein